MRKLLLTRFGIMLLLSVISFLMNYLLNVILARILSVADYGNFAIIKEVLLFASMLFLQGINFSVLKYVPEYIHAGEIKLLRGYLHYNFRIFIIGSFSVLALALLGLVIFLTVGKNYGIYSWLFLSIAALIIAYSALSYLAELIKAIKRIFLSSIVSEILASLLFALAASFFLIKKEHVSLLPITNIYLITTIIITIVIGYFCYRGIKNHLGNSKSKEIEPYWKTNSLHLMVSKIVLTILFSSEIIILKVFGSNPEETGIFAAILTICSLYWVLFNAVTHVLSPLISPLVYAKQKDQLKQIFVLGSLFLTLLSFILSIVLIIWRLPILHFFGSEFVYGTGAYVVTMIGAAVTVSFGLPWYFIGFSGHQEKLVWPVTWVTIISVIITAILVHYFNLLGAAIGLAATDVLMALLLARMLYKLEIF